MDAVQVTELGGSQVVSAYGYGDEPEGISGAVMRAFFEKEGWDIREIRRHRIFGFNNPNPDEGSRRYGYEHWITVAQDYQLPVGCPEGITLKEMPGGPYASLRVSGIPDPEKWGGVVRWINGSPYAYDASRQWLEEIILEESTARGLLGKTGDAAQPPDWCFNLMSPVIEAAQKIR